MSYSSGGVKRSEVTASMNGKADKSFAMEFLFKDTSFKFETLRAAGFAVDNGADLSEVLLTAAAIPEGDEEAWMRE